MTTLYHYTCSHRAPYIEQDGFVMSLDMVLGERSGFPSARFAWFTDLEVPHRVGLGLTSYSLKCDRTERRFLVTDDADVLRYLDVRRQHRILWPLEKAPGALPAHWWIARKPVPVVSA
jgi:hypothetical protein